MRTSALVLVLSVLPLASLASAAGLAQEPARADHTLGSWKLDVARSSYVGASLPTRSLVMTREQTPEGVRVTITGKRADGRPLQVTYVAPYDGKPHPAAGNGPFDTIAVNTVRSFPPGRLA